MRKDLGFAMLEILITLLVILVGVLGIAGIQLLAINNTETARYQSLATMIAASMAAEMQANPAYWSNPGTNITVVNTTITGVAGPYVDCATATCSAQEMAYYDLYNWGQTMSGALLTTQNGGLPSAIGMPLPVGAAGSGNVTVSGNINCPLATPMVCELTMYWSENNVALNNDTTAGAASSLSSGTVVAHQYSTLVPIL